MIGVFDSGHGGLTVFDELARRFPDGGFVYLGDHANAPYGDRRGDEVVALTKAACAWLFNHGCNLVLLGCNTATAVAARTLQQEWVPGLGDKNLLGIIAPTVEAVTQTPWMVKEPVFPQKYNTDSVLLFATNVTVDSGVYETEIAKRCPQMRLVPQACPALVPLIERGASRADMEAAVGPYVRDALARAGKTPEWAILGCTHYPLIEDVFRAFLPPSTRLVRQPLAVANALEDYLGRHGGLPRKQGPARYFTTGDAAEVGRVAGVMLGREMGFEQTDLTI